MLCYVVLNINRSNTMILVTAFLLGISSIMIFPIISEAQSEEKTFVTHSGSVIKTSGEVLDPLYTASTMEFVPSDSIETRP